jgi:hypothetical protein
MSETIHSSLKSTVKDSSIAFFDLAAGILLWLVARILIVRNTAKKEFAILADHQGLPGCNGRCQGQKNVIIISVFWWNALKRKLVDGG